ncbi:MAG: TniB family NTP-binding protein [Acetobacteraceae bacterium]|nr:TniB family NTP-binding protein [Acetobacteraceae bacterium]
MIVGYRREGTDTRSLGHVFVPTHLSRACLRAIEEAVENGRDADNCLMLPVLGPNGCGKTSLVGAYDDLCARGAPGFRERRLLFVQVTRGGSAMEIATAALIALGEPVPTVGTLIEKTNRVIKALLREGFDAVFFDEIHRVLIARGVKAGADGARWITDLLNATVCPIIALGELSFVSLLRQNVYLQRRTVGINYVLPCDWADDDERGAFCLMVSGMLDKLRVSAASPLRTHLEMRRLHLYSGGRIGLAARLLTRGRIVAERERGGELSCGHLVEASQELALPGAASDFNPFLVAPRDPRLADDAPDAVAELKRNIGEGVF